jgi:hypothetical protein
MMTVAKTRPDRTAKAERKAKASQGASVDEQSEESFPASDPPSFNATGRVGRPARDKDKVASKSGE